MRKMTIKFSVFLLATLLITACSESYDTPFQTSQPDQLSVIEIPVEDLKPVIDVQDKVTDRLFRNSQVVGTGTGLDKDGNPAIVVYTLTRVDQRPDINLENVGTGQRPTALPVSIENIPVVQKVTGMFKAYADPTSRFPRPVPIGVSSGHPDITAGTIGCRVKDASGNVYALSNNHVYANVNAATIGDNVIQPGSYDGGTDPADAIGTLYDYEPISVSENNTMDAAIALSSTANLGTATTTDAYGTPGTTTVTAMVGLKVQKYGRTTGHTRGEVAEINVTVDVCYESRGPFKCVTSARFVDQFTITPGTFSDGGDSGSLIVTDDNNNNPVGLLFAGSSERTIANPIDVVLTRFNVTIDDGSGGGGDGTTNSAPTAGFTYTTSSLQVDFTDQSNDSDGTVEAWSWNFGDNTTSTLQNPSHTYSAGGTYTVSLTVTDNEGATGSTTQDVTVTDNTSGGDISLSANGYKVRGVRYVDLTWSGATGTSVEIFRNNVSIGTFSNSGSYTDDLGRNSGTYTYKVCETDDSACSNEATVTF